MLSKFIVVISLKHIHISNHYVVHLKPIQGYMSILNLKKHMYLENRPVVAKGELGEGVVDWEFGISRCKLLHIA